MGDTLISSLSAQVRMLIDVSLQLVAAVPDESVSRLIESQGVHIGELIDSLEEQIRLRDERFDRAMARSTAEKARLRNEISQLEPLLPELADEADDSREMPVASMVGSVAKTSERKTSNSNIEELSELRNRLRTQMAELEQLRTSISAAPSRMVRADLSSSSDDSDPLTTLVFSRRARPEDRI